MRNGDAHVQNEFRTLQTVTIGSAHDFLPSGCPDPVPREASQPGFLSYQSETTLMGSQVKAFLPGRIENPGGFMPLGLDLDTAPWFYNRVLLDGFFFD